MIMFCLTQIYNLIKFLLSFRLIVTVPPSINYRIPMRFVISDSKFRSILLQTLYALFTNEDI